MIALGSSDVTLALGDGPVAAAYLGAVQVYSAFSYEAAVAASGVPRDAHYPLVSGARPRTLLIQRAGTNLDESSRVADNLTFPIAFSPQALTFYTDIVLGEALGPGTPTRFLAVIGAIPNRFQITYLSGTTLQAAVNNDGAAASASLAAAFVSGDRVQIRAVILPESGGTHSVQVGYSLNGGTEVVSAPNGAATLTVPWTTSVVSPVLSAALTLSTNGARQALDVHSGVASLATCESTPGDLFSYRPGDDLSGATFARASAADYTARV